MVNLHENMGPGRDPTCDPWICSQTHICCQTIYGLRYEASSNNCWHFNIYQQDKYDIGDLKQEFFFSTCN